MRFSSPTTWACSAPRTPARRKKRSGTRWSRCWRCRLLSQATERIGLVATVSTTYLSPYHLARKYATLDQISGGRAGWNLVTSGSDFEARSFGLDQQLEHAHRYARAHEYVQVVKGLWDTWEDDVFVHDKAGHPVL